VKPYLNLGPDDVNRSKLQSRLFLSNLIAIQHYLSDDLEGTRDWAVRVMAFADDWFLGPWRDRAPSGNYHDQPPDRAWQDLNMPWQNEFQASLLWGSCLGEWERLGRLASSLRDDIMQDVEQTPENRAWLLIAAGIVRGRPWNEMKEMIDTVQDGRRKRERLLLDLLDAILHGDDSRLSETSTRYFQYFKKSESKEFSITAKVAIDGAFLLHFGRHQGRHVAIPSSVEDYIINL